MPQVRKNEKRYFALLFGLLIMACLVPAGTLTASAARPPLVVTDLQKTAIPGKFITNGDIVSYTISFTMPSDLTGYVAAKIVDVLPTSGLAYNNIATYTVNNVTIPITMTASGNTLSYELTGANFKNVAGEFISLTLQFRVNGWTSGVIQNEAQVYFMPDYPDAPDAFDEEEIVRAIGPPTAVEEYPGDRKTALLWNDPIDGTVAYYEIKIDNFPWIPYPLSVIKFDTNAGTNGKWYVLFEFLPTGQRLVNYTEYTFQIRAIDPDGWVGEAFTIESSPTPLGDIGGRNTDLLSIYGETLMPSGGWPVVGGVGTSTSLPHQVTVDLPANFLHMVIHRNFIEVGADATFVMYSDPAFTNAVDVIDRLDNSFNWLSEVQVYIHVTSGNRQNEMFYAITVRPG